MNRLDSNHINNVFSSTWSRKLMKETHHSLKEPKTMTLRSIYFAVKHFIFGLKISCFSGIKYNNSSENPVLVIVASCLTCCGGGSLPRLVRRLRMLLSDICRRADTGGILDSMLGSRVTSAFMSLRSSSSWFSTVRARQHTHTSQQSVTVSAHCIITDSNL